jgi:cysteine-S-conjugate beta-lyase
MHGWNWLAATISAIEANVDLVEEQLASKLPNVRIRRLATTYLAWLDMSDLGWGDDPAAIALRDAKAALLAGPGFSTQGIGYARMNLGRHPDLIAEAVDRLAATAR